MLLEEGWFKSVILCVTTVHVLRCPAVGLGFPAVVAVFSWPCLV